MFCYNIGLEKSKKFIEKYMTMAIDKDGYIMEGQGYGASGVSFKVEIINKNMENVGYK